MNFKDEKDIEKLWEEQISWNFIKDHVYIRLMNLKFLNKYEDIVFRKYYDLAITFSVQKKETNMTISHLITNKDLEKIGIQEDEIYQTARYNTENYRKKRIVLLREEISSDNMLSPISVTKENAMMSVDKNGGTVIIDVDPETKKKNILVATNKKDVFGASYFIYKDVLEHIYREFGNENFYILPMSIHMVWFVRANYLTKEKQKSFKEVEDDLLDMIEEFNDTQNKSWKDILSYKIYYYIGDDGKAVFPIPYN